jgi:hypothetical protein
MRFLNTYKIFEKYEEWATTRSEVEDHFLSLKDTGTCKIEILRSWLSKDFSEDGGKSPDKYPGFRISISPSFDNIEFDKHIEFLKELKDCSHRLSNYYENYKIEYDGDYPDDNYIIYFLDTSWDSVHWSEDELAIERFMKSAPTFLPRYGTFQGGAQSSPTIRFRYMSSVSKVKSDANLRVYTQSLYSYFPDLEFKITEELDEKGLVECIFITCLGKKKSA